VLDSDTKRRIDSCRDILVGKVPDPKSQVEQITIALIYKFMDDMDVQAAEMGGKRSFFINGFQKYSWQKLLAPKMGGKDTLDLYSEAIGKMTENTHLPELFRDIFKNAYLPYRDPETLRSFLKEIDWFSYDHSEKLGDAFEYLLSVLGSQGDAGQFRTPRHIIDFIVEIVNPQKNETILDPACGTAGFLISAWKHILKQNSDHRPGGLLKSHERKKLVNNVRGYDISPDMVRLSLVNLYLHGFPNPHIDEYDTLTSEDRWNEYADVILANPPFMSPKGGIKPHKRFSVQSKRSEVLFVDYIAEHLSPTGRAGIIVPEGVIFQSQTSYAQLRKILVEQYLVAVISLPSGVFNPYSGVKTSILILDKALAKHSDTIAFFKIENDGFGLGAQRRSIIGEELTQVKVEIEAYLGALRGKESTENLKSTCGHIVPKEKIAANGDYNLSSERYREGVVQRSAFPLRQFEEVCTLEYGASLPKEKRVDGPFPVVGSNGTTGFHNEYIVDGPAIIVGRKGSAGEVTFIEENCFPIDTTYYVKQTNPAESDIRYLYWLLKTLNLPQLRGGAGIPGLNRSDVYETYQIPLPPLDVQKEIVAEIEGYQKVINGARAVLDNYRPHIPIHPEWPIVPLEETCEIQRGKFSHRPRNEPRFFCGQYPFIQTGDIVRANGGKITYTQTLNEDGLSVSKLFQPPVVVITIAANIGDTAVLDFPSCFPDSVVGLTPKPGTDAHFLELAMRTKQQHLNDIAPQAAQKNINIEILKTIKIPLPPLATQQAIVAELEAEQALVAANRELITRFEKKIQATLARVWGEEAPVAEET